MTPAELLMDLAREIEIPIRSIVPCCGDGPAHVFIARAKLALDLKRAGPKTIMMAIIEGWDFQRIVREIY